MPATFLEVRLLKLSDLDRRIHQPVIILSAETAAGRWQQRRGNAPRLRHADEVDGYRFIPQVHRIHENFRQIEERMMLIDLSPKGTSGVSVDLIFDRSPALSARNFPPAFLQFLYGQRMTGAILGVHPVHVLGEVTCLV